MMNSTDGSAPTWLFSFVDLAFLMLIAMTQLAPDPNLETPNLGEMIVPQVNATATSELGNGAVESWQLRVHPPAASESSPYQLVRFVGGEAQGEDARIIEADLREELLALKRGQVTKPMLTPHADSRSQDMLEAAALIEEMWPGRRRAAVRRVFDRG
jgi:hypothetical protein